METPSCELDQIYVIYCFRKHGSLFQYYVVTTYFNPSDKYFWRKDKKILFSSLMKVFGYCKFNDFIKINGINFHWNIQHTVGWEAHSELIRAMYNVFLKYLHFSERFLPQDSKNVSFFKIEKELTKLWAISCQIAWILAILCHKFK